MKKLILLGALCTLAFPALAYGRAGAQSSVFRGRSSTFGGPHDYGVKRYEGLALIGYADLKIPSIRELFLPAGSRTVGLARRLNPDKYYIACRWDYRIHPKDRLKFATAIVRANGRTVACRPVDWGPSPATGRAVDLSPAAARRLGVDDWDQVRVELVF